MKLKECLKELDIGELKELATELSISVFNDAVRSHFERNIIKKLTSLDYLNKIIEKMDKPCVTTLVQLVYFGDCNDRRYLNDIRKKGLVYKNVQVPNDISKLLENCLYPKITKNYNKLLEVKQTPFLNLIILIGLFMRDEIKIKKTKKNRLSIKINTENKEVYYTLDKKLMKLLISFLDKQYAVYWEDNLLIVNRSELRKWIDKDDSIKLELLYKWLRKKNKKVLEMVSVLGKVQKNYEDWIDMNVFIEGEIPYTKESIEEFGLIYFEKIHDHYFVRLTPEGWYYIKGTYPEYWCNKSILISADFEVFIPHDYDPNIIYLLDKYGQLKDNDYFLVYDIDPSNWEKGLVYQDYKSYQMFIKELETKSISMPQVVGYELKKL